MTIKYEEQCWYCGRRDMENKGSYVQCRSCGATWNERPPFQPSPLADHGYYIKDEDGKRLGIARRARPIRKPKS